MKLLVALVENGNAENIRRQQIGRELQALESRINRTREGLGERGLASAGIIFQQHVSAGSHRGEEMFGGIALPTHDAGDVGGDVLVCLARGVEAGVAHEWFRGETVKCKIGCGEI